MTEGLAERIKRYRNIAEETRAMAAVWTNSETIATITRLADEYDCRADAAEAEARAGLRVSTL